MIASGYTYSYTTSTATTSGSWTYINSPQTMYSYIPSDIRDQVEAIMGKPGGAKFLISYAYKKDKDPVIFIQSKKELIVELKKLLNDQRVDKRTILISEISRQFKPTKKLHMEALKLKL